MGYLQPRLQQDHLSFKLINNTPYVMIYKFKLKKLFVYLEFEVNSYITWSY